MYQGQRVKGKKIEELGKSYNLLDAVSSMT